MLIEEAKKNGEVSMQPFVLYTFRHTFLTLLAENGCDPWTLARIAGWSDINISKRYVHPSDDAVLMAVSRLPLSDEDAVLTALAVPSPEDVGETTETQLPRQQLLKQ